MLARHGYGVLLFDRRGEGESEGDPNLFGWQGERDIHAAVAFLQRRPDVDPRRIGGIGLSVGGEMMIEAAAESRALKAIVTEGAAPARSATTLVNPGGSGRRSSVTGVATAATALFTNNLPPADAREPRAEDRDRAVFFVYGEQGQPTRSPPTTASTSRARAEGDLGGRRTPSTSNGAEAHPKEYERRIVAFFDRALLEGAD